MIRGDYHLKCVAVEIQSEEIEKQLRREITPSLSQDKINAFLELMSALIGDGEIQNLERIPEESHCPLEVYYKIDDVRVMVLLRNCRRIFKGQEYSAVEEFVHRHKDDGVLLLRATYKIQITQRAYTKKRAVPPPMSFKNEGILGQK